MLVSYITLARQPPELQASWTKATQLQTGSARANYYRKGSKSDSSGCLQRRGIAAAAAGKATGAAPSGNHAFIANARPVTIT